MSAPASVEAEGTTVDEAVDKGLAVLGALRDEVEIEVLANPSRGLFGLGGRAARVRLTRNGAAAAPPRPVTAPSSGEDTLAEQARVALADLLRRMGFASEVDVDLGEESPVLHIRGDNTSVLIGKHGQTLDALEYVLNRMIARDEETVTRIHLDCEHYREKRRQSLGEMALRMAEQVRKRGRAVTLDPLSPRDRRTVHLALQNEPEVTTRSTGEGSYRQLQILPQRSGGGSRGG